MTRYGSNPDIMIDYINYSYIPGSNRLSYAKDSYGITSGDENFPGTESTSQNLFYDANGNVTRDYYRNATISYNQFNLPYLLDFGNSKSIEYIYNGSGQKAIKVVVNGATPYAYTDYLGQFIYEYTGSSGSTRTMKAILTPEGRIVNSGTNAAPVWKWEYNLTDHLGNVRVVVAPAAQSGYADVLQENNYYPFGMKMSELCTSTGTDNDLLYNGKELQDDFGLNWYDYGARFYDPALGKFHTIDPMAETINMQSPYLYASNNPLRFIDAFGMYSTDEWMKDNGITDDDLINLYTAPSNNSNSDGDQSTTVETGIPTSIMDVFDKIGESIKNMMFSKTETPDGKTHYSLNDQTAAIERGPVAVIISGNAAAQMYTGGVDVSLGVLLVLKGANKGAYAITDMGVPIASSGFSAGIAGKITPIFFAGNPNDFSVEKHIQGTRIEINSGIPLTPIVAGGFHSTGTRPQDATFGLYIGYGISKEIKGVSLRQPLQINLGYTNVLGN